MTISICICVSEKREKICVQVSQGTISRSATVVNMAGREWDVPLLEDDGITPLQNAETPAKFLERYTWQKRGELLESHGFSAETDERDIPKDILREADHILQTPLSLVEFVDEEDTDRTFNAKGEVTGKGGAGRTGRDADLIVIDVFFKS
jgi:hypothetical protein